MKQNLARLTYKTLRRTYRVASKTLMSNENAFAVARQALSDARTLCNNWEVGFCRPESREESMRRNISTQWRNKNGQRVLFASLSLTKWLKTA